MTFRPSYWENNGGVSLREVLPWCLKEHRIDTLLLITRGAIAKKRYTFDREIDQTTKAILGRNLIEQFRATAWPGTRLVQHTAKVYAARFDQKLMRKLISVEDSLLVWTHEPRRLPEDICVFRSGDEWPTLVSVTHEKFAYVLTSRVANPPGFVKGQLPSSRWLIGKEKYFCDL